MDFAFTMAKNLFSISLYTRTLSLVSFESHLPI